MSFNNGIFCPDSDKNSAHLEEVFSFDHELETEKAVAPMAANDLEYMIRLEQNSLNESDRVLKTALKSDIVSMPSQPIPICTSAVDSLGSSYVSFKNRLDSLSHESGVGSFPSSMLGLSPPAVSFESQMFGTSPVGQFDTSPIAHALGTSPISQQFSTSPLSSYGTSPTSWVMGNNPMVFVPGDMSPDRYCEFCFNNERVQMERMGIHIKPSEPGKWRTHVCKDAVGNVVCPILYKFNCKYCGASGHKAHTRRYCPVYQQKAAIEEDKPILIHRPEDLITTAAQIPEEALSELENLAKSLRNLKNLMGGNGNATGI